MNVCCKCDVEMRCVKTGAVAVFGTARDHVYPGDKFACSGCGNGAKEE